ncbi:non-ribosomal peptide synthase/polyketide synthase [Alkaliphilus transvaalensis]|uniref:non-ribosomal peptide synthase/polyketide synthase n=1 Tax=Alkaliphilus transvaalensis TaxID=114628 RepID=UPI00054E1785|nr:non-ribosomal peptide synthetase [Alkaliphilus transvaalensis]
MVQRISKENVEDLLSLSPMQEGLLFHYLKDPDNLQYIEQLSLKLEGPIQGKIVSASWNIVAESNEMLRTVYRWKGIDKPLQIILREKTIPIIEIDISTLNGDELENKLKHLKEKDREEGIDLEKEPFRVTLIKLKENLFEMIMTNHHIILDGWSTGIILKEFLIAYDSLSIGHQPNVVRKNKYKEFIKWCNYQNPQLQKAYWENYLKGFETITSFPVGMKQGRKVTDSTKEASKGEESKEDLWQHQYCVSDVMTEKIQRFTQENRISMATVLYVSWGILLQNYSNSDDVIFGTTLSGRPPKINGIEEMVGLFINTLPTRVKTEEKERIIDLLKKLDGQMKEREAYENTPLIDIKNYSQLERKEELFDNILVVENYPLDQQIKGISGNVSIIEFSMFEVTNFDLALTISVFDGIQLNLVKRGRANIEMLEGLLKHYVAILDNIVTNPSLEVAQIDMLSEEEKKLILKTFNDTKTPYPQDKNLHQLIEEQVKKTPNNVAVLYENETLTYRELNEKSNQLARLLIDKGVKRNTIVGIMVERSLEMMVGLLAILKAGGAYLPIDPEYPEDRINFMLSDSSTNILLTQSWIKKELSFAGEILSLNKNNLYTGDVSNLSLEVPPNSLAYVIYTSGSTGKPKGVMIRHGSLINRLNWMQKNYPLDETDTILQKTPFTFDVSLWELFWWGLVGAKVYMLQQRGEKNPQLMMQVIEENKITTMHFVPSMLSVFLDVLKDNKEKYNLSNLKQVFASGEALTKYQVELFQELIENRFGTKLTNLYGPTEATVDVSYYDCFNLKLEKLDSIPIGKPIDNISLYITNKALKLQPVGVPGELCISGVGLAEGYLNRLDLTTEKFVDNPYCKGEKIYKTGDLARWLPDGNIEYLGRIDHQVKIRGFRIELGEIEGQLLKHKKIKEAVVIAIEEKNNNDKYLCGYYVADGEVSLKEVREHIANDLPEYMIPSYIMELNELPLSSNGKIDRKALPYPTENMIKGTDYIPPSNKTEETLVEIWKDILSIANIGTKDNFFELGGHSLKATTMVGRIHKVLGVEVPLKEVFNRPTIKGLAAYIQRGESSIYASIKAVKEEAYYPMSSGQKRIYTLQQFDEEGISYNISGAVILKGRIIGERLEEACQKLINRHESLRTSFEVINDEPVQIIHQQVPFELQYLEGKEEEIEEILHNFVKSFDLRRPPLFRGALVTIEPEKHYFLFDMHHIISDGTSIEVFIKEFAEVYQDRPLDDLKLQYKDFSLWQNQLFKGKEIEAQKNFWLKQFEGEIPVLNLMGDYPRPPILSFTGDSKGTLLSKELSNKLRELTKETEATLYMIMLAAFNVLLSKYTSQEEIIIGSPIAGRHHSDLEGIIGMFVNTLAMRNFPKKDKSFKGFLEEVKENALKAYENQDYQFEELVESLNLTREMSRNPLFDVVLAMENMEMSEIQLDGQTIQFCDFNKKISKFDMTMFVKETKDGIKLDLEYSTKLFKDETIVRILEHYENILNQIIENPEILLANIELITINEKLKIINDFNNTKTYYPKEKTIHQLLEERASLSPNYRALTFEGRSMTYGELNARANQVARILVEKGVKPDTIVAIMADRSFEMVIAIFGILKAGAAYMPIDPDYPEERKQYMLEDSGVKLLLTQPWLLKEIKFDGEILLLTEGLYQGETSNLNYYNSNHLAYVLYTSGSTGRPKGVMIQHNSSMNILETLQKQFPIIEGDAYLLKTNYCFDVSVIELFAWFMGAAGRLVILNKGEEKNPLKMIEVIKKERITHINFVPSMMQVFLDFVTPEMGKDLESLKHVILGGEAVTKDLASRFYRNTKGIQLENIYGPTENTIYATKYTVVEKESHSSVPIGKPIQNNEIYILNQEGQLLPIGVPGELCIGGESLGRGYLNKPELTAERYTSNPFRKGERMYKTGDLARWLPDGNIEFLGRIDHQVKIRGYRIELGEIENILLNHELIKEAIVVPLKDGNDQYYLCGYITTIGKVAVSEVREFISNDLPDYMIPSFIIKLEEFPLTANGKVNRKALPQPDKGLLEEEFIPPRDHIEEALAHVWQEVLEVKRIGINHNFFDLGGHSLKATSMTAKIHKLLNVEVPLKEVFKNPTIKGIAHFIKSSEKSRHQSIEVVEEKDYYETSPAQRRLFALQQLEGDNTGYNMPSAVILEGNLEVNKLEETFHKLIKRHDALRTSFHLVEGEVVQFIDQEVNFNIQYLEGSEEDIEGIISSFIKPFDLAMSPLLRIALIRINSNKHILALDMHHIISDGETMGILIKEFAALYNKEELEGLRIQYKDYSHWQNKLMTSEKIVKQRDYWLKQLEGELPVLDIMGDYPRPAVKSFEGDRIRYNLNKELTAALRSLCSESGATMYMVLLSAFTVLLSKYSRQEDIIVGSPIAGRSHGDLSNIMGVFINTLAMRNYPTADKTLKEFLEEVKENALKAYENQDYQFEELVEKLQVNRDISRNPVFDVMFFMENADVSQITIDGLVIKPYFLENKISKFDMNLSAVEGKESITIGIEYSTKLFKNETIQQFYQHFEKILAEMTSNLDVKLSAIDIVTDEEKQLIEKYNASEVEYPTHQTLQQLFEEQVEKTPYHDAVVIGDQKLSYLLLNQKANQLAHTLRDKGVKPNDIVGIMLEPSLDLIVGIMAILKAGGAYLPIEPGYPEDRILYMLENSKGNHLLTNSEEGSKRFISEGQYQGQIIYLDHDINYSSNSDNLNQVNKVDDLAYIIYTSGSTGRPKGVVIKHRAVVNTLLDINTKFSVTDQDRILSISSICFDLSVYDVFGGLATGAAVVLVKDQKDVRGIIKILDDEKITFWNSVPAFMEMIIEAVDDSYVNENLKNVLMSGDWIPLSLPNKIFRVFPKADVYSGGGATEASIWSIYYPIKEVKPHWKSIPYGIPLGNQKMYVMDQHLNLAPIGVPGEVVIGGVGVAEGYCNDPERTAKSFVIHPNFGKVYRTGDLAVFRPEGHIEFLGRIDNQVKIRGFRIELGEIESNLMNLEGVKEAIVTVRSKDTGKYICAYYTGNCQLTTEEIRNALKKNLPDYMLPSFYIKLDKLPLSANGKIDRKALPEPTLEAEGGNNYVAPRNRVEEVLVNIWQEILGIEGIGIYDNFFELGGHSLKATSMISKISRSLSVDVPLREIFKAPTIREIGEYIQTLEKKIDDSIIAVEEKEHYPTSSAQRRLFTLYQLDQTSTAYNMPVALEIDGEVSISRVEDTLHKLIKRHEALRTSFSLVDGVPVQRVHPEVKFTIQEIVVDSSNNVEKMVDNFIRPFELDKAPLLRAGIARLKENKFLLVLDLHHIISDGISMGILVKDFIALYKGEELKELKIQYKDYSQWQHNLLEKGVIDLQEEYWLQQLAGEIPVLNLKGDYPRPSIQSFEGNYLTFSLNEEITKDLRRLAHKSGATLYMVLLSVFNVLLSKYSGQEEIIVGSPVAGRRKEELSSIMGMFVNTLAMRNFPESHKTYRQFLYEVKEQALKAYENQDYQFEELVEHLQVKRDFSRNPLFDVMFTMQNTDEIVLELEALTIKTYDFANKVSKFDMTLMAMEVEDHIQLGITYSTKIFKEETIGRLFNHLEIIIKQVLENTEVKLSDIPLISESEKQLLETFNGTAVAYNRSQSTIHQLFVEQVKMTPDNIAIVFSDQQLTYGELNHRAGELAIRLKEKGVGPNRIVGILAETSIEMIVAIIAVLKVGAGYVPIDREFPEAKIRYILQDSNAKLLLTQRHLLESTHNVYEIDVLEVDNGFKENLYLVDTVGKPEDIVYTIYTSGTTGKSKGVAVCNQNLVNYTNWFINATNMGQKDKGILLSSFAFDLGYTMIYSTLLSGGQLHLLSKETYLQPEEVLDYIASNKITMMKLTPSHYRTLVERDLFHNNTMESLRYLILGGEEIKPQDVEKTYSRYQDIKIMNHYGPTETTIGTIAEIINPEELKDYQMNPTIGRPISNAQVFIMDQWNQLKPIGVPGELCIAGYGVALGYLNKKELTEEKFVENPFVKGQKIYKTGDLARWLSNGKIQFLGRIDHQVKVRGYRIELGEVEHQLLCHPAIKEAVVLAHEDEDGNKYLCAYIVSDEVLDITDIRGYLIEELPEYMVPSYYHQLDRLPLTPNGKLDRRALPKIDSLTILTEEYVAPTNEREEILVSIWQDILKVERIGINHNFFEVGGHSLKAMTMVAKVHEATGIEIPLRQVFTTPTIKGLAEFIEGAEVDKFVPIELAENQPHYQLSPAQKRLYSLQQFEIDGVSYNMPRAVILEGTLQKDKLEEGFITLIERHESLRTSFRLIDDEPVQVLHKTVDFQVDYSHGSLETVDYLAKDFVRPFDLSQAPLLRVKLIKISDEKHLLLIDLHHIISDGVSMGILIKEFMEVYNGKKLNPLKRQYKDFSQWQNRLIKLGKLEREKQFWLKELDGEIPVLNLMGDFQRPPLQSFRGSTLRDQIDKSITETLKERCKETGTTLYMVLLSAFNVLLSKYSGQEDIIVGTPIAGRSHGDLTNIMGMFVNTLAMRNYPKRDLTVRDFLLAVKERSLKAYENQNYQFEDLVEQLNLRRDISRNPLFDVMFAMENLKETALEMEGLTLQNYDLENDISKFDITLTAIEVNDHLEFAWEYATDIFKKVTIERMLEHFKNILAQMVENLDIKIEDINLLSEEAKEEVLVAFNQTSVDYPRNSTIKDIFEEVVKKVPNKIAAVFKEESLTYKQLNERANQLANILLEKGVGANTVVGVIMERSLEMMVGIMAVLKAGGAYLPIDPQYPTERIKFIIQDCQSEILLTQSKIKETLPKDVDLICLDEEGILEGNKTKGNKNNINIKTNNQSSDLAYILYTSGSTGKPKGVMIEQKSVVNLCQWLNEEYAIENKRVLQMTTFTFDVFAEEVLGTFLNGGILFIPTKEEILDDQLYFNFLEKHQIQLAQFVPSTLQRLANVEKIESLEVVISGGDELKDSLAEAIMKKGYTLYNNYGPTEATTDTLVSRCKVGAGISIGKPINNVRVYVVDEKDRLLPVGIPGELWIAGEGLAKGYLNRPDLTAEKFTANPFVKGERVYRTGDLVRWLPEGDIQFLGRIDSQVKIRGYRIEIGEIENRLLSHPAIDEAIVLTKKEENGSKYLCGYYTIIGTEEPSIGELRTYLEGDLPEYMIPSYLVRLENMPYNTNGKIDRRLLLEEKITVSSGVEYEAPRDYVEEILVNLWREVLSVDEIGINDDFFQLGGHSLKATALVAKIHRYLNVALPLKEVFRCTTIKAMAQSIRSTEAGNYVAIKPVGEKEYYAISPAQRRLYALQQLNRETTGYNIPGAIMLEGKLDITRLEETFNQLINRHESFRTSFKLVEGEPVQVIHKKIDFKLDYKDVELDEIEEVVNNFVKPFDLSKAPLLRVGLLKLKDEEHLLVFDLHHIISDGKSMELLVKEFALVYEGSQLQPLRLQYKDYSQWQRELIDKGRIEEQKRYWLQYLSGDLPILNLMGDYPRPAIQSFEGDGLMYQLSKGTTDQLKDLAKRTGTTLYMVILAAFNVCLSKYSGQADIIVGSPIEGRRHDDLSNIIGMFVNTLAMRNYPEGEKTFEAFLDEVKINALKAYENQDYQFEELVSNLNLSRDLSRNPIFDVMFNMQTRVETTFNINQVKINPYQLNRNISKVDLTLVAVDTEEGLDFAIEFSTRIFKRETIESFYHHFINVLSSIIENPRAKLAEINMMGEDERELVVDTFNQTEVDLPHEKTISEMFEEQVKRRPQAIALKMGNKSLTYQQLNEESNRLARQLIDKGVSRNSIVAVLVERSFEMIIGIMAILKSGAAYLPIDPQYPEERIKFMLTDSRAKHLITTKYLKTEKSLQVIDDFSGSVLYLGDLDNNEGNTSNFQISKDLKSLIYMIYTSGSTGRPKGVMIQHHSIINFIKGMVDIIDFGENKSILALTTVSFDIFFLETLLPLTQGMKVVIANEEEQLNPHLLGQLIKDEKLNMLQLTPSRLKMLLEEVGDGSHLRQLQDIMIGGETLNPSLLMELRQYTKARIYNMYGPTETTIWSTVKDVTEVDQVTIGKPIANTKVFIINNDFGLQPIGIAGELCIGGKGLAKDYLNRPELSKEKFIDNPVKKEEKIYRTGDLARWLPDGNIEFLGRIDNQVKFRGYRIELGEIEGQLIGHHLIDEAVVLMRENQEGVKFLCGYVVSNGQLSTKEIKTYLGQSLPEYMIPAIILQVDTMPLTPNGKIDRKALPEPRDFVKASSAYEAPSSKIEEALVDIWKEVLSLDQVSINDDFFEIGGNSIKIIKLANEIEEKLAVKCPVTKLFLNSSIKTLAENLSEDLIEEELECVVRLNDSPSDKYLFLVHGVDGDVYYYRELAKELENDYRVYGIQSKGMVRDSKLPDSPKEMMDTYLKEIKIIQKEGPYLLGGFCAGVMISYELTRMLEDEGKKVEKLIILDGEAFMDESLSKTIDLKERISKSKSYGKLGSKFIDQGINIVTSIKQLKTYKAEVAATNEVDRDQPQPTKQKIKENVGNNIFRKYLPTKKIESPTVVIKATETTHPGVTFEKWKNIINHSLEFYESPGDHESMLMKPHVTVLAQVIKNSLSQKKK